MAENPKRQYVTRIVVVHPDGDALIHIEGVPHTIDWQGPMPSVPHVTNAAVLIVDGVPVAAGADPYLLTVPRHLVAR